MSSTAGILDKLERELSRLSTEDEKMTAVRQFQMNLAASEPITTRQLMSQGGNKSSWQHEDGIGAFGDRLYRLLEYHGLTSTYAQALLSDASRTNGPLRSHVLERAPCANANLNTVSSCSRDGVSACAGCKLVTYCSKECQKQHWKTHKLDCKDPVVSLDWRPAWTVEGRLPAFIGGSGFGLSNHPLSVGEHLWGNIPSVDILNLSKNEGTEYCNNLDIMFAASGDIRNLIKTVNGLPLDYTGHLNVIMNDHNPKMVMRNLALLLVLGATSKAELGADIALHMWYSAFVPADYNMRTAMAVMDWLDKCNDSRDNFRFPLTASSDLRGSVGPMLVQLLLASIGSKYSVEEASNELSRCRFASDRTDYHHRRYLQLQPTHRLACLEYRRFGLVLPFGALNAHFNQPNRLLFDYSGKWVQKDHADPLEGYHIPDVIASGKAHGALPGDLYGCLYFHLSDQLRAFSERLSKLRITIQLFNQDASRLGKYIQTGACIYPSLSSHFEFDRIDLSNIIDPEYVTLQSCLKTWGPLLKRTPYATLYAYSMNWPIHEKGATVNSLESTQTTDIIRRFLESDRIPLIAKIQEKKSSATCTLADVAALKDVTLAHMGSMNVLLDNSAAFERFMKKQNVVNALRQSHLKLKTQHTIVPHRFGIPLDAPKSSLPSFIDDRDWYLQVCVGLVSWTERFLEFQVA